VKETPVKEFVYWSDGEDPFLALQEALQLRDIRPRKIALDAAMPVRFSLPIARLFPDAELINGSSLVQELRIYKDRQELDFLIEASRRAEQALQAVTAKGAGWIGKKETEFQAELAYQLTAREVKGGGGLVAVGANAAVPHHYSGSTGIENNKCLLIDFGGTYQNYSADMTRTYYFGKPDQEFREVYAIVLEANRKGEEAAKSGNQLQDVDRAARSVIEKYGYGEYFIHRTGHGIGIDGHEGPSAGEGETTEIRPGMVFSVEPGIYLPGKFGVRIEDLVAIELDGSTKVLNHLSKELTVLD
jgi:Xaa-Pro aminopeptidase